MKTISMIISFWLLLSHVTYCQPAPVEDVIRIYSIEATTNKTSSIIFPSVIKSVDRGSGEIIAQKAKGVTNVLQLKTVRENIKETNLTVITADGILYQFKVNYSSHPLTLTTDISNELAPNTALMFQSEMTESKMEDYATTISGLNRRVWLITEGKYKIHMALLGIYIKEDVMFYSVRIKNNSNINYDIDFLKFYVRDKSKIKRTASQEVEIRPIYVHGNIEKVKGGEQTDLVFALEKFTIPESKNLNIELIERNGGRHFNLKIKNKTIVKAKSL